MFESYLEKAKQQFEAGKILFIKGYYNDALSRLYYAIRSIGVFLLGKPEKGKWQHSALMKKLVMEIDRKGILDLSREDRKLIKDFARIRKEADYELVEFPKEKVEVYIWLVERLLKEVENAKNDNKN
jgi:uncharacterized protein (UPF0332 family)